MRPADLPPEARAEIDAAIMSGVGQRDAFHKWGIGGVCIRNYKEQFYSHQVWPTPVEIAKIVTTAAAACGENPYDMIEQKQGMSSRIYAFVVLRRLFPCTDPEGLARCVGASRPTIFANNYSNKFRDRSTTWDERKFCAIIVDCGVEQMAYAAPPVEARRPSRPSVPTEAKQPSRALVPIPQPGEAAQGAATGGLAPKPSSAAKAIANYQRTRLNQALARAPAPKTDHWAVPTPVNYAPERGDASPTAVLLGDPPLVRSALYERLQRPVEVVEPELKAVIVVPDEELVVEKYGEDEGERPEET